MALAAQECNADVQKAIGSMGLGYLHAFTIKSTQMRLLYHNYMDSLGNVTVFLNAKFPNTNSPKSLPNKHENWSASSPWMDFFHLHRWKRATWTRGNASNIFSICDMILGCSNRNVHHFSRSTFTLALSNHTDPRKLIPSWTATPEIAMVLMVLKAKCSLQTHDLYM